MKWMKPDPAALVLLAMMTALAAICLTSGCATLQTVTGDRIDEALEQGEQAVAVARAALALYEQAARMGGKTEIEVATIRDIWLHRIAVMEAALADLRAARDQWRPAQK
jgi:hypothetical protein